MKLSELLESNLIFLQKNFKNKTQLIEFLIDQLVQNGKLQDKEPVFSNLLEREEINTSAVNDQIAVPHLRTDVVKEFVAAFCSLRSGLEFGALDKQPVHHVLLLLAPKEKAGEYLTLLARFSRIFKREENRKKVLAFTDVNDFIMFINNQEG